MAHSQKGLRPTLTTASPIDNLRAQYESEQAAPAMKMPTRTATPPDLGGLPHHPDGEASVDSAPTSEEEIEASQDLLTLNNLTRATHSKVPQYKPVNIDEEWIRRLRLKIKDVNRGSRPIAIHLPWVLDVLRALDEANLFLGARLIANNEFFATIRDHVVADHVSDVALSADSLFRDALSSFFTTSILQQPDMLRVMHVDTLRMEVAEPFRAANVAWVAKWDLKARHLGTEVGRTVQLGPKYPALRKLVHREMEEVYRVLEDTAVWWYWRYVEKGKPEAREWRKERLEGWVQEQVEEWEEDTRKYVESMAE